MYIQFRKNFSLQQFSALFARTLIDLFTVHLIKIPNSLRSNREILPHFIWHIHFTEQVPNSLPEATPAETVTYFPKTE